MMHFGVFKGKVKVNRGKKGVTGSLFDVQLKKIEEQKKSLSKNRNKIIGEYLYDIVQEEHKITNTIDQKAGTQLTFLPLAVTIFAGIGGLLLSKEGTQKLSELWMASVSFYGMSLIAFIVSGIYALFSIKVAAFPGINLENVIDFGQKDTDYYFTMGEHFEYIIKQLREVNDRKAFRLYTSQLALLIGLIFVTICFVTISVSFLFF